MANATKPPRRRHPVPDAIIRNLYFVFRYSPGRDAYILRFVGHRFGPVLVPKDPGAR